MINERRHSEKKKLRKAALPVYIDVLEARRLMAFDPAALLKDINAANTVGSSPASMIDAGNGKFVFTATNASTGKELYASDGTTAGTKLLNDLTPGVDSSTFVSLGVVGNRVIAVQQLTSSSFKTFGIDLTTGVAQQLTAEVGALYDSDLVTVGSVAYFSVPNASGSETLYRTDGTTAGTSVITTSSDIDNLRNVNGTLLARMSALENGSSVYGWWRLDGTNTLTRITNSTTVPYTANIYDEPAGGPLYYTAFNGIYRTDGTAAGTTQVIAKGSASYLSVQYVIPSAGATFLMVTVDSNTRIYTIADGATTATQLDSFSTPYNTELAVMNGTPYYFRDDASNVDSLYKISGGVPTKVANIVAASQPSYYTGRHLTVLGNKLIFHGTDVAHGRELWVSDGTTAGTSMLVDLIPGTADGYPYRDDSGTGGVPLKPFLVSGGKAFFAAGSGSTSNIELFGTDGTATGTALVKDVNPQTGNALPINHPLSSSGYYKIPQNGVAFNGKTYFAADNGVNGTELWSTDGTAAGTQLAVDIYQGATSSYPVGLVVQNGKLFFIATSGGGIGVYASDGTSAGTTRLTSLDVGSFTATGLDTATPLVKFGTDKIAFFASQSGYTYLFTTDGTAAGTVRGGQVSSTTAVPTGLTVSGSRIFYSQYQGAGLPTLVCVNGTTVTNVATQVNAALLTDLNGTLLYRGDTGGGHSALFALDPGSTTPRQIMGIEGPYAMQRMGDAVYLFANKSDFSRTALFRTDGTTLTDLTPGVQTQNAASFMEVSGGRLFFGLAVGLSGVEPWISDGTVAGTYALGDLNGGTGIDSIKSRDSTNTYYLDPHFTANNGLWYFEATNDATGTELYVTDGTAAGTHLVDDLVTGTASSFPNQFVQAGGKLFAAITTADFGRELIRVSPLDTVAPTLASSAFDLQTGQDFRLTFSEDLAGTLTADDVRLVRRSNGATIAANAYQFTVGIEGQRTVGTLHLLTTLPDDDYSLLIDAGKIADASGNASTVQIRGDFFLMAGDVNHDRTVNFDDLIILAQNYNKTGQTFAQGNIDHSADGNVNFDDLIILAQQYNKSLPAMAPLLAPSATPTKKKSPVGVII